MLYPVNVPDLVRRTVNGAFATDPTIPYSPARPRRLAGTLAVVRAATRPRRPPEPRARSDCNRRLLSTTR